MDINCPYCGAHYELDDSLLPEGNIKVKCRVCSNVFILSKNFGAFKAESPAPSVSPEPQTPAMQAMQTPSGQAEERHSASDSPQAQASGSAPASLEPSKHSVSDDFMKSIMSEINSAVAEEASGKHKKDSGSDAAYAPSSLSSSGRRDKERKGRTSPLQIAMLIVLILVFLIAAASALVHYNIINIPFLPSGVSDFLSSF